MEHGGHFGSWKMLELNLFVQLANLHDRCLDKPIPNLRGLSYRLKQIFALFKRASAAVLVKLGLTVSLSGHSTLLFLW